MTTYDMYLFFQDWAKGEMGPGERDEPQGCLSNGDHRNHLYLSDMEMGLGQQTALPGASGPTDNLQCQTGSIIACCVCVNEVGYRVG